MAIIYDVDSFYNAMFFPIFNIITLQFCHKLFLLKSLCKDKHISYIYYGSVFIYTVILKT